MSFSISSVVVRVVTAHLPFTGVSPEIDDYNDYMGNTLLDVASIASAAASRSLSRNLACR
jgi:hypothetical protein